MLRISRLSDYGLVVLSALADADDSPRSARMIAETTGLPEPTVAKLLKCFAQAALVRAKRGAQGGYLLSADPTQVSVAQVLAVIDGPVAITECARDDDSQCDYALKCQLAAQWRRINDAIFKALDDVTLADLARPAVPVVQLRLSPGSDEKTRAAAPPHPKDTSREVGT